MHDVVATATKEMPEDTEAEDDRRQDSPAALRVEGHPRTHGNDPHARHARAGSSLPLPQRQVCDVVALRGEVLRQGAVPTLGAADGVGVEAVVDDADANASRLSRAAFALAPS